MGVRNVFEFGFQCVCYFGEVGGVLVGVVVLQGECYYWYVIDVYGLDQWWFYVQVWWYEFLVLEYLVVQLYDCGLLWYVDVEFYCDDCYVWLVY